VSALLIDEPEVSLHPQLQAFLLHEILSVVGDPIVEPDRKLIVIATHSEHMVPLRNVTDLVSIKLVDGAHERPREVSPDAPQLRWKSLPDQLQSLQRSYRAALFARTVLLVEGESDETIVNALAHKLDAPLAGTGVQVLGATGKDAMPNLWKLFGMLGKRVVVLADLDGVVDGNSLCNLVSTHEAVIAEVQRCGLGSLSALDGALRSDFAQAVDRATKPLEALEASGHWAFRWFNDAGIERPVLLRRAAAWLALNGPHSDDVPSELHKLRTEFESRFTAVLNVLV
jgi:hypothetical protein